MTDQKEFTKEDLELVNKTKVLTAQILSLADMLDASPPALVAASATVIGVVSADSTDREELLATVSTMIAEVSQKLKDAKNGKSGG